MEIEHVLSSSNTVFPRINARGVYFKIRDFRGAFIRGGGGVYFKISKIVETGYGRTKIFYKIFIKYIYKKYKKYFCTES